MAVSHPPYPKRIILAFRGTYSIANTVVDLSTIPQEYEPYPGDGEDDRLHESVRQRLSQKVFGSSKGEAEGGKCENCTVHAGFMTSWGHTRDEILPDIEQAILQHPGYQLTLVGHSLGGAVAALASLEFQARGWNPQVTTFGEPRIGNDALMKYLDDRFDLADQDARENTYRRVTHVNDPVPLLPLKEWGYRMHGGEIYISKDALSPSVADLEHCIGDEDPACIGRADPPIPDASADGEFSTEDILHEFWNEESQLSVPARYRLWELFFAHRDYFWRLGLCVPGGDPHDWYRTYPEFDHDEI